MTKTRVLLRYPQSSSFDQNARFSKQPVRAKQHTVKLLQAAQCLFISTPVRQPALRGRHLILIFFFSTENHGLEIAENDATRFSKGEKRHDRKTEWKKEQQKVKSKPNSTDLHNFHFFQGSKNPGA